LKREAVGKGTRGISRRQAQDKIMSHEKIHVAFRRLIRNCGYDRVCPEYEITVKNEVLCAFAPDEESQN
jgi:hypothetical protein